MIRTALIGLLLYVSCSATAPNDASAQDAFQIRGMVNAFAHGEYNITEGTFAAIVNYDANATVQFTSGSYPSSVYRAWTDSIESVSFMVYDVDGEMIYSNTVNRNRDQPLTSGQTAVADNTEGGDSMQWYLDNYRTEGDSSGYEFASVVFNDQNTETEGELVNNALNYPNPDDAAGAPGYVLFQWTASIPVGYVLSGSILHVETIPTDSDGDGFDDDEDACPHSDLSETVTIDGRSTRVENDLMPDGCTIADLFQDVIDSSRTRRQRINRSARLITSLRRARWITWREARQLTRAVSKI